MNSVEVLYSYDYDTIEGKHISISKGDVFTLLAKSTEEWWKVRKGDKEKFYVPANYVKILSANDTQSSSASGAIVTAASSQPALQISVNGMNSTGSSHNSLAQSSEAGSVEVTSSIESLGASDEGPVYANSSAALRLNSLPRSNGSVTIHVQVSSDR